MKDQTFLGIDRQTALLGFICYVGYLIGIRVGGLLAVAIEIVGVFSFVVLVVIFVKARFAKKEPIK